MLPTLFDSSTNLLYVIKRLEPENHAVSFQVERKNESKAYFEILGFEILCAKAVFEFYQEGRYRARFESSLPN